MRWNPFKHPEPPKSADSSFETTLVDDAALARLVARQAPDDAAAEPPASGRGGKGGEGESIGHVGRYALKSILGKGGLGTVYAAWDPLLSRTVALKTLHIDADPAARESLDALFLNEARAAAGLSHPHIVTVFDAGPSDTGVYIAMERLQGQDLRKLLKEGARPGPIEAAHVVRRVADALAYAHSKGVVHCDVKPANIFMTGRMHPKVLDFGIARVAHRDVPALEGVTAGSPFYLAPEQIEGRLVDGRSDVYSLGVVLYELLVGKRPFEGRSLDEITQAVTTADVVPTQRAAPQVPAGLATIADRAMARDPEERFASAGDLALELRHWLESAEARALRNEPLDTAAAAQRGHPVARIALPLAALVVVAGGLAWMKLGSSSSDVAAAAPAASAPVRVVASPVAVTPVVAAGPSIAAPPAPASAPGAAPATDTGTGTAPVVASVAAAPADSSASAAKPGDRTVVSKAEAARRRKAMAIAALTQGAPNSAVLSEGVVQLAVSPWGQVEVDGKPMGISPPLSRLTLSSGNHTVTVRNTDFPAYTATVTVDGESPVVLRHRFGP